MHKSLKFSIKIDDWFYSYFDEFFEFYKKFISFSKLIEKEDLIYSKIYSLKEFPEIYQNHFWDKEIRVIIIEWKVKIYYKIDKIKKEIIVLRIWFSSQNDSNFF